MGNQKPVRILAAAAVLTCLAALAGCSTGGGVQKTEEASQAQAASESVLPEISGAPVINTAALFTKRDSRQKADLSGAQYLTLEDGTDLTVSEEGVFVLSGSASDVTVTVDAPNDAKVQLVLNGVTVENGDRPFIDVQNADKVFVTTAAESENTVTVTGAFSAESGADAAVYSKEDLVLNGLGTLTIVSPVNGIASKDDLKVTGGTIHVTAGKKALHANDSIAVSDGTLILEAGTDGLHAENGSDPSLGYIVILGGTVTVDAKDDALHANAFLQTEGGTITLSGREGIESTFVRINGGTIAIDASDDGINAGHKSDAYPVCIEINGGTITIDARSAETDGIDANGDIRINGGEVSVNAEVPFDFDGTGVITGGSVTCSGEKVTELVRR